MNRTLRQIWMSGKYHVQEAARATDEAHYSAAKRLLKRFHAGLGPRLERLDAMPRDLGYEEAREVLTTIAIYRNTLRSTFPQGEALLSMSLEAVEEAIRMRFLH